MRTGEFQATSVLPSLLAIPTSNDDYDDGEEYDNGDDDGNGDNPNVQPSIDENVTNIQTKYHSQRPIWLLKIRKGTDHKQINTHRARRATLQGYQLQLTTMMVIQTFRRNLQEEGSLINLIFLYLVFKRLSPETFLPLIFKTTHDQTKNLGMMVAAASLLTGGNICI